MKLNFGVKEGKMRSDPAIPGEIDQFDRRILVALSEDGRMSITDLSARVGLSKTPCQLRLRRLIAEGYIDGFRAIINPSKLGLEHIAFVEVKLVDTREPALEKFNEGVKKLKEVEECHISRGARGEDLEPSLRLEHLDECGDGSGQGRAQPPVSAAPAVLRSR
jgi:DNA-binding Lrp family transcriptional regulator